MKDNISQENIKNNKTKYQYKKYYRLFLSKKYYSFLSP